MTPENNKHTPWHSRSCVPCSQTWQIYIPSSHHATAPSLHRSVQIQLQTDTQNQLPRHAYQEEQLNSCKFILCSWKRTD